MAIKTSSAKAKGRRLQQWVRDQILDRFTTLTTDDVRSTAMGQGGEDVQLSSAARDHFPYSIECKAQKQIAVYRFMDQAEANCPDGSEPLVVIKADRRKPLVVVDAKHFFSLAERKLK